MQKLVRTLRTTTYISRTPKFTFASEIKISQNEKKFFYPIKGLPDFQSGEYKVFQYTPNKIEVDTQTNEEFIKPPQVPYEIKEHAFKGFFYTFFLTWVGRYLSNFSTAAYLVKGSYTVFPFIPAGVFAYHYSMSLYYMMNAVTAIKLKEDGMNVILEFKNMRSPLEVEIWRIKKGREETFLNECYSEPFLFPITVDYSDKKGEYSLFNKKTFYLYGDSHNCVKDGELLRAILNSESIRLN